MDAKHVRTLQSPLPAPAGQLKRVPRARWRGPHARCGKSIQDLILETMAVGMQIVSPHPISVRRCPSEYVQDRMFLPDRNQMNRSGCPYERR